MNKHTPLYVLMLLATLGTACTGEPAAPVSKPASAEMPDKLETAVLGAGCFWCVEAFYERLDGVHEVVSGYAGGKEPDPSYQEVAGGQTSHAEVVKVFYDPEVISYRELIDFFWTTHDATRGDGVWPDFGPQYRSILLYENEAHESAIRASLEAYENASKKKVATEIKALDRFYRAETYHQDYARKNPNDRYVRGILNPKLEKLGLKSDL